MRKLSKIAWWDWLIVGFIMLLISLGVNNLVYGNSNWHGFSSWEDMAIFIIFLLGDILYVVGLATCYYQVLVKGRGEDYENKNKT